MLQELFQEVDRLAERHREALEYEEASERTAYLYERMQALQRVLNELREVAKLLQLLSGDSSGEALWRNTCAELRTTAPASLQSPGRALIAGNLDLLRLIDYTGASIATVTERRNILIQQTASHLSQQMGIDMAEASLHISHLIERIVESQGSLHIEELLQKEGWIQQIQASSS